MKINHLDSATQYISGNHILVVEGNGHWNAYTHGMDNVVKINGSSWNEDKGIYPSTVGTSSLTSFDEIAADLQSATSAAAAFTAMLATRNK